MAWMSLLHNRPDIASEQSAKHPAPIPMVGMEAIEIPVQIVTGSGLLTLPAQVDIFVNLADPSVKGIHMSRLYNAACRFLEQTPVSFERLSRLSVQLIESQAPLSTQSFLTLSFRYPLKQGSLLSDNYGWRYYPVTFRVRNLDGRLEYELEFQVLYSSTCPCSAALSRHLKVVHFDSVFADWQTLRASEIREWLMREENMGGTPHAQRSVATLQLRFDQSVPMRAIPYWIELVETTLKTTVQTSVKREDEQEFARLNAENLMFCEDAVRMLAHLLDGESAVSDYWVRVQHMESLHPHDAAAVIVKGIQGGFSVG